MYCDHLITELKKQHQQEVENVKEEHRMETEKIRKEHAEEVKRLLVGHCVKGHRSHVNMSEVSFRS